MPLSPHFANEEEQAVHERIQALNSLNQLVENWTAADDLSPEKKERLKHIRDFTHELNQQLHLQTQKLHQKEAALAQLSSEHHALEITLSARTAERDDLERLAVQAQVPSELLDSLPPSDTIDTTSWQLAAPVLSASAPVLQGIPMECDDYERAYTARPIALPSSSARTRSTAVNNAKLPTPQPWSGTRKEEDARIFLARIKRHMDLTGVSEQDMPETAAVFLGGQAFRLWDLELQNYARSGSVPDWPSFCRFIERAFGQIAPDRQARARYNALTQTDSPGLFVQEFRKVIGELSGTWLAPSGGDVVSHFLEGCKPDLRTYLETHAPNTGIWNDPEEMFERAITFGIIQNSSRLDRDFREKGNFAMRRAGFSNTHKIQKPKHAHRFSSAYKKGSNSGRYAGSGGTGGPVRRGRGGGRHSAEVRAPGASTSNVSRPRQQYQEPYAAKPAASRSTQPTPSAPPFAVPHALIRQREEAGFCGFCRVNGHRTTECRGPPMPALWGEVGNDGVRPF